jgi:hypothetical protein
MKTIAVSCALGTLLLLAGCATRVQRIDESERIDLSGRWNDTDSRLVAEEMIRDSLSRPWLRSFQDGGGRPPTLVVGLIQNKSHELITVDTFVNDIEREYVNSGKVRLVLAGQAREDLRRERADQQENASPETVKRWGREIGADFILQGVISSIVDTGRRQKVVFYQVDLGLTSLETNEQVWIGTKKIKKLVSR